ncbi:hypothetical protein AABD41_00165 [Staphylococcus pseudoxylosus]|uniref:hypothetical protein n=1 Tax=Staphylococcus pseudoxylosus TaxID=2282419 RepID=UPI00398B6192
MIGKVIGGMTALIGTALLIGKPFLLLRAALLGATELLKCLENVVLLLEFN